MATIACHESLFNPHGCFPVSARGCEDYGTIAEGGAWPDASFPNSATEECSAKNSSYNPVGASQKGVWGMYQLTIYNMCHYAGIDFAYYWSGGVDYGGQHLTNYEWQDFAAAEYVNKVYGGPYKAYLQEKQTGTY